VVCSVTAVLPTHVFIATYSLLITGRILCLSVFMSCVLPHSQGEWVTRWQSALEGPGNGSLSEEAAAEALADLQVGGYTVSRVLVCTAADARPQVLLPVVCSTVHSPQGAICQARS
jgi:hypothetical protein